MKIDKNIIALGLVSFFTDMASSMITTILPLYIVYILNDGVDKLGFILAIATFVSYGFRFLFGYLSDRFQVVKPFVVIGYTISAITKPLLYFSSSWQSVATLRGVERIGKSIRSATKDRLISAYSSGKSGKTFGFHKMMDIAGEMMGAIIVFLALFYIGKDITVFKSIFAWSLLPGILAVITVIFFVKDVPYTKKKKKKIDLNLSQDKKLLPLLYIYFGFIFFMFNDSFFIIKAKENISIEYIPLFIVLLTFTQTITSYYFGILTDKIGVNKILNISYIFGIVAMGMLYFNFIFLSFIFLGLFLVSSINSLRSYISNEAINKASIYGILYTGVTFFNSIGVIIISLIWKNYNDNFAIIFSLIGIITIFIINILFNLYNKSPEKNEATLR